MAIDVTELPVGSAPVEPVSPAGTSPEPAPTQTQSAEPTITWDAGPEDGFQETPVSTEGENPPNLETPVPPDTTPKPPALDLSKLTPEQLATHFATLSHDELAKIPAYNQQVQRAMAKARTEENQRLQVEVQQQQQIAAQFQTNAQIFAQWKAQGQLEQRLLSDPNMYQVYHQTNEWFQNGGYTSAQQQRQAEARYGVAVVAGLKKTLGEHAEFKAVVDEIDALLQNPDPVEFFTKMADKVLEKERAKIPAAIKAGVTAELAKHHITVPSSPSVNSPPVTNGHITVAEYEKKLLSGEWKEDGPEAERFWAQS